jgi:thiamine-monophosphate kinase
MAATPCWGLLSMGVRANHDVDALLALQRGVTAALEAEKATVVGGNLARVQGAEWYDLTLVGEVERGRAWTRRGARPGDLVAVTGHPGRAGAGCALAQRLGIAARGGEWADLFEAWLAPRPRLALSRELAQAGCVTAAIDVSDGFASDLSRLCEAGGVGARLEERLWPVDRRLAAAAARLGVETDRLRFGASDDYELLLAIKPPHAGDAERVAAGAGVPFAVVGRFTGEPGEIVWAPREGPTRAVPASGWDHFGGDGPRA